MDPNDLENSIESIASDDRDEDYIVSENDIRTRREDEKDDEEITTNSSKVIKFVCMHSMVLCE